ncbi:MAG TPA: MAPEG family protein [Caulobacteraceae bacterium]
MSKADILWPMGAMALLTFCALGLTAFRRIGATLKKEITLDDFRYGESANVSVYVSIPNRAMMNLLELPVLFYVICIMSYMIDSVWSAVLYSAWFYVGLRVVHTAIHLSYNNVLYRLIAFAASNVVLIAMWVIFFAGVVVPQASWGMTRS